MNNKLKSLRIQNNYTEEKIANLLNISKDLYIKYENSNAEIPLALLIKLSRIYNTSIDYIISDTNIIEPHKKAKLEKTY